MRKDKANKKTRGVCDKNSQISWDLMWDLIGRLLSQTHTNYAPADRSKN